MSSRLTTLGMLLTLGIALGGLPAEGRAAQAMLSCPGMAQAGQPLTVEMTIAVGTTPLGAYSIVVGYDPSVLTLASVAGGTTTEFSGTPTTSTPMPGRANLAAYQSASLTSPTGVVSVAMITFNVTASTSTTTDIALTVKDLYDTNAMPILPSTVPLAELAHRAAPVAHDLHLHVPRPRKKRLEVEVAAAERRLGLGAAARPCLVELLGTPDDAHAAPATAGDGLHHGGRALPERREKGAGLFHARRPARPAQHGHAATLGQGPRRQLVAEERERLGPRSDEGQAGLGAAPREARLLAQEAVARMHGVAPRLAGDREELLDVEVRARSAPAQAPRRVDVARVERVGIVLGEHTDGRDAQAVRRPRDADRDLPPVGHQQACEAHRRRFLHQRANPREAAGRGWRSTGRSPQRGRPRAREEESSIRPPLRRSTRGPAATRSP